jgi:hypothetical protein
MTTAHNEPPTLADLLAEPRKQWAQRRAQTAERDRTRFAEAVKPEPRPVTWWRRFLGSDGRRHTLRMIEGFTPHDAGIRSGEYFKETNA